MTIYWGDGTSASTAPSGSADEQRIKAWVSFDGTGSVSVHDSYRVSSVTDFQTGRWQVNWQDTQANSNYSLAGIIRCYTPGNSARTVSVSVWNNNSALTTNYAKFFSGWVGNNNSGSTDSPYVSVHLCN